MDVLSEINFIIIIIKQLLQSGMNRFGYFCVYFHLPLHRCIKYNNIYIYIYIYIYNINIYIYMYNIKSIYKTCLTQPADYLVILYSSILSDLSQFCDTDYASKLISSDMMTPRHSPVLITGHASSLHFLSSTSLLLGSQPSAVCFVTRFMHWT